MGSKVFGFSRYLELRSRGFEIISGKVSGLSRSVKPYQRV